MLPRTRAIALVGAGLAAAILSAIGAWAWFDARRAPVDPADVPVTIGGDAELDGCPSPAVAAAAEIAVRAGPGESFRRLDTVHSGEPLIVCGYSTDGSWIAVVYPPAGAANIDCGVSTPIGAPTVYAGPCRSGWVPAGSIDVVAG